ncbi:MAG TPA: hypothetical protein VNM22_17935, partial [Candidatus Limnocylindrales bacterium]|nr:hypothetical protein [Candidatus Limnocylindrales bacterium]
MTGKLSVRLMSLLLGSLIFIGGVGNLNFAWSAEETPPPQISAGDTAWMLTSAALVLMMTAPGLALFYGG